MAKSTITIVFRNGHQLRQTGDPEHLRRALDFFARHSGDDGVVFVGTLRGREDVLAFVPREVAMILLEPG